MDGESDERMIKQDIPFWVKDVVLLENLSYDRNSAVDWIADNANESLWAVGCNSCCKV